MKKRLLLIPLLLSCLFLTNFAYAQEPIPTPEYTLDLPCFVSTKITFNYAYTNNNSIYDITTIGASLYKYSGGPTYMEFIAEDVDDYFFTFQIGYNLPTNQSVLVGIWSGTLPMQGLDYKGTWTKIVFHIRLRVQNQPSYPTEEEVANQVVAQVQKNLDDYYKAMNELVKSQNTTIFLVTGIAGICVISVLVIAIVFAVEVRNLRRLRGM